MFHKILKAQSAIEYLMTYGWMLLVVAIVGGAIFSMVGDQNIESVQGFTSNEVVIDDFGVSSTGLMFSMQDPLENVKVSQVQVSESQSHKVNYTLNQELSEDSVVNLPGVRPSSESDELEVKILYDSGNLHNLTVSGQISGNLELDEKFHGRDMILEGLKGYWPMSQEYSEDDIVYDISGNQNHGEIIEDAEADSEVIVHKGRVEHVENGFTRIPYGEGLEVVQNPHTYVFMYRREDYIESNMFFTQSSWSNNERMYIGDDDGEFGIGVAGNSWSSAGDEIEDGKWYFMALILDGEEATLYVNGEYQNSKEYVFYPDTVYEIVQESVAGDYAGRIRTTGDGEDIHGEFTVEANLSEIEEFSFWYEANQIDYEWAYPAVNIGEETVWKDDYTSEEDNAGHSPDWDEVIVGVSEFSGVHNVSFRLEDEGTNWDDRWVTFDDIRLGEKTFWDETDFIELEDRFNSPLPEPMKFDMNLNMGSPSDYSTSYKGHNSISDLKIYDRDLSEEELEVIQETYETQ